jgi:hypothetical protein
MGAKPDRQLNPDQSDRPVFTPLNSRAEPPEHFSRLAQQSRKIVEAASPDSYQGVGPRMARMNADEDRMANIQLIIREIRVIRG